MNTPIDALRVAQFQKKPVVISAVHFDGTKECAEAIIKWMGGAGRYEECERINSDKFAPFLVVTTLEDGKNCEAKHVASVGDWIIKGVQGEFYPCKPDIFAATYDVKKLSHRSNADHIADAGKMVEKAIRLTLEKAEEACNVLDKKYPEGDAWNCANSIRSISVQSIMEELNGQ